MKTDLTDITFLLLIRLDSIQRLENILLVTERLTYYFDTNIHVREVDNYDNGILKSLLSRKIQYVFVEDKDPVLYKTRHFNRMLQSVTTPYLAIWDADIIPDKKAILECVEQLRSNKANVVYPYNGICYNIPEPIKSLYFKKKDIRVLYRHISKMEKLYTHALVGGAMIMDTEKYRQAGGENEKHYGWGNDDFDRYYRFIGLGYTVYRFNTQLFHLCHIRGNNSHFSSLISSQISSAEKKQNEDSSKAEIEKQYKIPEAEKVIE